MSSEDLIAGRYEVLEELGRGGVGRVVLALDRSLGRKVAVKTLLKAGRAEDQARFVEEARITGQLTHPNVVTIHALGVHEDELHMVMKLVNGRDLKQIRKALADGDKETTRAYPLRRLLRLYLQVCEAVGYAHARGVIHRDLKTANVMVTDDDEVLLLDWGLAKAIGEDLRESDGEESVIDEAVIRSRLRNSIAKARQLEGAGHGGEGSETEGELTMQGQIVGTPAYMPPEQADSGAYLDARADVYALGSTLYELLAYRAPYVGSTYACLKGLIEGPPTRPSLAAPDNEVPPEVEAIVLKAMARDPALRYPDARSLAQDVAAFLDGGRVGAYTESAKEAIRRWVRQNRVATITAAVCFILLNVLILVATGLVVGEERAAEAARAASLTAKEENQALGAAAKRASALAGLAAEGEARLGQALELSARLAEATRVGTPLSDTEAQSNPTQPLTLYAIHSQARARLVELATAQAQIKTPWEQAGGEESALEALQAPLQRARLDLDRILVEGLIARRPSLALCALKLQEPDSELSRFLPRSLPVLDLGAAAPLVRARALWRAGREPEARQALGGAAPSEPAELRASHIAFKSFVDEAPLQAQLRDFDRALELQGGASWLLLRRGIVKGRLGERAAAEEDFERARVLTPLDAWVHGERARLLDPCYADSEMLLSKVSAICLELSGQEERGGLLALLRARTWRGARDRHEELAKLGTPSAWRDGAEVALISADLPSARALATKTLELWPTDRHTLGLLAQVALAEDKPDEALELAERGLQRYPEDGALNRVRGLLLRAQGELERALPYLVRGCRPALTSDPWRELAEVYLELNRLEEGVEAARTALSHDPLASFSYAPRCRPVAGDPRPHRVLGRLRRAQGKLGSAILHHARSFGLWSQSKDDRVRNALGRDDRDLLYLGELHEELGLLNEAANYYQRAAEDPALSEEATRRLQALKGG